MASLTDVIHIGYEDATESALVTDNDGTIVGDHQFLMDNPDWYEYKGYTWDNHHITHHYTMRY